MSPSLLSLIIIFRKWKTPWKNIQGVVSTIRMHLKTHHKDIYEKLVKVLGITHLSGLGENGIDEPFDVKRWNELLMKWVVADDQVSLMLCSQVVQVC